MTVKDVTIDKSKFCYNGNEKLMRAGSTLAYTEEQITEIIKCSKDIIYFIENYVYIVNVDHGLMRFNLYPYQKEMIKQYQENRFNISLLARQMGKCLEYKSLICIKNKKTGEVMSIPIGEFYDMLASQK